MAVCERVDASSSGDGVIVRVRERRRRESVSWDTVEKLGDAARRRTARIAAATTIVDTVERWRDSCGS